MSGVIPAELGNLANLKLMWLNSNRLTGRIPAELGRLTGLIVLDLSENQLSGEIPAELGSLAYLAQLSLRENQLSGQIPGQLGTISGLWELNLSGNQLTGCIPVSLEHVHLNDFPLLALPVCSEPSGGEFTGDEEVLVALYNATDGANWTNNDNWLSHLPLYEWHGVRTDDDGRVTALFLGGNRLRGEIPAELSNLTNLDLLILNNNQLSGEIPPELGGLTNLILLGLSGNQFSGEIPPEFGNLANLEELWLHSNQLTGEIPPELDRLTNLFRLYVSENQLSGCVPDGVIPADFGELGMVLCRELRDRAALTALYDSTGGANWADNTNWLSYEPLWSWYGVTVDHLGRVTELALGGKNLSGELPADLGNLPNLEVLEGV